jgi:hypothetical protein
VCRENPGLSEPIRQSVKLFHGIAAGIQTGVAVSGNREAVRRSYSIFCDSGLKGRSYYFPGQSEAGRPNDALGIEDTYILRVP